MEDGICLQCIEDHFLRKQVALSAQQIVCVECDAEVKGITIDDLGELLEPVMRVNFELTPESPYGLGPIGDDIEYVIGATLRQDLKCMQALIEAVCRADPAWPPDGEEPFSEETSSYTEHTLTFGRYRHAWDSALDQLKTRQR